MCICALFVGEKCEGGALEFVTILLELGQCFGADEACVSNGAKLRAGDLWSFAGAGAVAVYNVMQIWVHAFGVRSFYHHTESGWRGCGGGAHQDMLWWRI
jgi:hypothetical protein